MDTLRRERQRAVDLNLPHYRTLHNVGLYLLVFEGDFSVMKHDAFYSTDMWRRNLAIRIIGLMVYEVADDLSGLLGNSFRATLREFPLSENQWSSFNSITNQLANFRKEHRHFLKDLRNYVAAHRDHDAAKQLEIIEDVNFERTMNVAGDLYGVTRSLIAFLTEVTRISGDGPVALRHLLRREAAG